MLSFSRKPATKSKLLDKISRVLFSPPDSSLEKALESLADVFCELPDIDSAAVIAYSSDFQPRAIGRRLLNVELDEAQLAGLAASLSIADKPVHSTFKLAHKGESVEVKALAAKARDSLVGAVLLGGKSGVAPQRAVDLVAEASPWVAATILTARQAENADKLGKLHDLARRELGKENHEAEPDLEIIAVELRKFFRASSCAILLQERASNSLRVSASTDGAAPWSETLAEKAFSKGAPQLQLTVGKEELAVPIRAGNRSMGVVCLSRKAELIHFSADDESALYFFADLLGIALSRAWDLLVSRTIEESESIAFAITHREQQDDNNTLPRMTYVNTGAEKMLEETGEASIIGRDAREFYAPGEYEKIHERLESKLEEARRKGRSEVGPVDSTLRARDGSLRPVRISYRILADRRVQPSEIYTIGIFRDRTREARIQSHRDRLMEMLNSMGIAYFRVYTNGDLIETSEAEADILGYSREEILKLNRAKLYDDPRDRDKLFARVERRPGELISVRQPLRRKDGTRVTVSGYIRMIREPLDGGRVSVEGLYRDVTRRLEIQSFVDAPADRVVPDDELYKKLKEHEQRQHDYLSSLGHQLITPLGSLVANLDDLRSGLLEDKAEIDASLRWNLGQAKQCMRMVRNLSYLDKILRQEPFEVEKLSMARICIETKLDFLHLLEEKDLHLLVDDSSIERHVPVHGHGDLLRQAIVNLVDNAIKYSRPRTKIEVRGATWPNGRLLELTNEGLPIPEEARSKVFERGFRTNRARAVVPHGTGLGLWLVRRILAAHDATITCDEYEERGRGRTRFRILFPHPVPSHRSRRSSGRRYR